MQEKKITITWYGTASVRISSETTQILIDPFIPFPDSKIKIQKNAYDNCKYILVSHGHFDHISSIPDIVQSDTTVYCTRAPYRTLCRKGVPKENLHLIQAGSVFFIGDIKISALKGNHIKISILKSLCSRRVRQNRKGIVGKLMKIAPCLEKKESLCYLAEGYGKRILILGSLALAENTDYPTGVDLAFFPYQGASAAVLAEIAAGIYEKLKPQAILLTHFDNTFPPFSEDVDTIKFEHYLKNKATLFQLKHGSSFEL